jgi:hypothetical protein
VCCQQRGTVQQEEGRGETGTRSCVGGSLRHRRLPEMSMVHNGKLEKYGEEEAWGNAGNTGDLEEAENVVGEVPPPRVEHRVQQRHRMGPAGRGIFESAHDHEVRRRRVKGPGSNTLLRIEYLSQIMGRECVCGGRGWASKNKEDEESLTRPQRASEEIRRQRINNSTSQPKRVRPDTSIL